MADSTPGPHGSKETLTSGSNLRLYYSCKKNQISPILCVLQTCLKVSLWELGRVFQGAGHRPWGAPCALSLWGFVTSVGCGRLIPAQWWPRDLAEGICPGDAQAWAVGQLFRRDCAGSVLLLQELCSDGLIPLVLDQQSQRHFLSLYFAGLSNSLFCMHCRCV